MQKVHDPVVPNVQKCRALCGANIDDRHRTVRFTALAIVLLWSLVAVSTLRAQDTPDYFRQNCMNCHTIGGGRLMQTGAIDSRPPSTAAC